MEMFSFPKLLVSWFEPKYRIISMKLFDSLLEFEGRKKVNIM